jgi:hypothetical protein
VTMERTLAFGSMRIPSTFEVRTSVSIVEPPTIDEAPMRARPSTPAPRANIVVEQGFQGRSVDEHLASLRAQMSQAVAPTTWTDVVDYRFDDDHPGRAIQVTFPTSGGITVVQRFICRRDGDLLTQFTVTVDHASTRKLGWLHAIVASYQPPPR